MDDRLRDLAVSLDGVFCSGDAHRIGLDDQAVDRLVAAGEVARVRRGTFILGEALRRATPEAAFGLRVRAVLRARGPEVAASHHAAAVIHGAPLYRVDLGIVDLIADVARRRTKAGVTTRPDRGAPVVDVVGWRVVTLPVALVQLASSSGISAGVVAMDAAVHHRRCTVDELARAADALALRYAAAAHRAVALVDPLTESVGETLTRLLLCDLGLPVRPQVDVRDARGLLLARVDFLVGDCVIVEFDGAVKYAGADGRDALVAEKRRESALTDLGYEVVRIVWSDLDDPVTVLRRIRAAYERAARRRAA